MVDINPYKQGMFLPGTGHEVLAPEILIEIKPDLVVVMNQIYRAEITETAHRRWVSSLKWYRCEIGSGFWVLGSEFWRRSPPRFAPERRGNRTFRLPSSDSTTHNPKPTTHDS